MSVLIGKPKLYCPLDTATWIQLQNSGEQCLMILALSFIKLINHLSIHLKYVTSLRFILDRLATLNVFSEAFSELSQTSKMVNFFHK